jgi:RNA polymerase sigma factor (sigma-70 family)
MGTTSGPRVPEQGGPLDGVEPHVEAAVAGDRAALEAVRRAVQGDVYNLAVRMLWCPEDAADATQEILIQVATHLSTFRGESSLRTWVWRIATRHVLRVRRSRVEREEVSFSGFGSELASGLSDLTAPPSYDPDQALLEQEVMIGCTSGMLLCLDRDHRIAYVLGEVFEVSSDDAAEILGVSAATYRKRLSRARERLRAFLRGHCG